MAHTKHISQDDRMERVGYHTIDATIFTPDTPTGTALLLHGAGASTKNRLLPLANALARHGYQSLTFSFPGHGSSSGLLENSSLKERRDVAEALMRRFNFMKPDIAVGVSMGAHTAVSLLASNPKRCKTLALLVPAAYSAQAEDIAFNKGFTQIIRQANSYQDSNVWNILGTFSGNMAIISAGKDTVIPKKVLELYKQSADKAQLADITVAESPHRITTWLNDNPTRIENLARALHTFDFSNF